MRTNGINEAEVDVSKALPLLDRIRVASPCPESWAGMRGDDRVRHCDRCNLNVFNLSDMTRDEAEALIAEKLGGRLCVRYYQRTDGTILTRDCPVGVARIRWALARVAFGIAAAVGFVFALLTSFGSRGSEDRNGRLWGINPFSRVVRTFAPPRFTVAGDLSFDLTPEELRDALRSLRASPSPFAAPTVAEDRKVADHDKKQDLVWDSW